jgi:NAD(P)-dependent dehydrogenase (short-subunit alcohol dehydrogenase family)
VSQSPSDPTRTSGGGAGGWGDVAVVTGAAGALGAEVARTLRQRGCKLALVDSERAKDRLEQLAVSLGGAGAAIAATGDVTAEETWAAALPRLEREFGSAPSLAVLTAGAWRGGKRFYEEDESVWRTMITANLETAYRSMRALLPGMVAKGRGSVVLVGSRAAVLPSTSARAAAYAASKAAVVALAQAVAAEVAADGVRVNVVLPSTMDTPANRAAMPGADASAYAQWVSLASAASVIAFLLSDDARDISGAAVPVYGRA